MKKHIIGFAIFSLIVGSAVLVKAFFGAPSRVVVPVVETVDYVSVKKNSCWKMKQESVKTVSQPKLTIVQAVFDLNTKQMDWELNTPQTDSPIALHFFTKNKYGTRYLATEFAPYPALNRNSYDVGVLEFTSSYQWLDELGSYQNLYVIPEQVSRTDFRRRNFQPAFDESEASSVLLYTGKAGYPTEKYFKK